MADYPAEPALWQIAAEELLPVEPEAAREILLDAIEAQSGAAGVSLLEDCAAACLATGDAAGALEQLGRLPSREISSISARLLRATAALELGQALDAANNGSSDGEDAFLYSASRLLAPVTYSSEHASMVIEHFASVPGPLQREALRVLARRRGQPDSSVAVASAERAAESSHDVGDWRYFAGALRRAGRDAGACEAKLAQLGTASPAAALDYAGWLMVQHRAPAAIDWFARLPAALTGDPRLQDRRAVLLLAVGNEDGFKTAVLAGSWGRIDADAVELALSAHLAAGHEEHNLRRSLWQQALAAAGADPNAVRLLVRMAMDWRWREETAQAFDALLQQAPHNAGAARQYVAWAHRENDTALWQQASLAWRQADPASADAKRTWAHLALVRGDPATLAGAVAAAEELARSDPGQLPLLALARHQQHRDEEAIEILEKLPLEQLTRPRPALYYGVLLASAEPARASRYLDYAARGHDLLPEERAWLKQARNATGAASDNPAP